MSDLSLPILLVSGVIVLQFILICYLSKELGNLTKRFGELEDRVKAHHREFHSNKSAVLERVATLEHSFNTLEDDQKVLKESQGKTPPVYLKAPDP